MGFFSEVFGGAYNNREYSCSQRCSYCGKFCTHHVKHVAYPDGSRGWVETTCSRCGHKTKG
jgi:hypothetical protein